MAAPPTYETRARYLACRNERQIIKTTRKISFAPSFTGRKFQLRLEDFREGLTSSGRTDCPVINFNVQRSVSSNRICLSCQHSFQFPFHNSLRPSTGALIGLSTFCTSSTARMRRCALYALLSILTSSAFAADSKPLKPCTIVSPTSGDFYDLNTITVQPPKDPKKARSWHARGYDYGTNFTLNFCAPVIETLTDVVDVDESSWQNISAYYTFEGKTYSIG